MTEALTYKPRLRPVQAKLWVTLDNQLVELSNGRLLFLPRYELTDNNSNPFGDNDLADVRASHFHDFFCYYHKAIYLTLTKEELMSKKYLKVHESEIFGDITICADIPKKYVSLEDISFNEANNIFKEILLVCGTTQNLAGIMRFAVGKNLSWKIDSLKWKRSEQPIFNLKTMYKKQYGKIKGKYV